MSGKIKLKYLDGFVPIAPADFDGWNYGDGFIEALNNEIMRRVNMIIEAVFTDEAGAVPDKPVLEFRFFWDDYTDPLQLRLGLDAIGDDGGMWFDLDLWGDLESWVEQSKSCRMTEDDAGKFRAMAAALREKADWLDKAADETFVPL